MIVTRIFYFTVQIVLPFLLKDFFLKTMSFISSNKLFVLFFGPKLQLYLQINNFFLIQTFVKSNVVQASGTLKKQTTPKQKKSIGVQYSKPRELQIIIPMWDRVISLFHFFIVVNMWICNFCCCAIFFHQQALHLVWKYVCCFQFVHTKSKINSLYQLPVCKNSKM